MIKPKQRDRSATPYDTFKEAQRECERLKAAEPGRYFGVVPHPHPRKRGKYAVGIFAAGVLLMGYV